MPKINYIKQAQRKPPEIDWLWAAVLERKMVYGHDLKTMAGIAGVSYDTMRRYITMSPWKWKDSARDKVCAKYGIKANFSVSVMPLQTGDGV